MKTTHRSILAFIEGLLLFAILIGLSLGTGQLPVNWLLWVLYCFLIVFAMTFAMPIGGGYMSLLPMASVGAYLTMGLVPAGWVVFIGSVIHGWIRYRFAATLEVRIATSPLQAATLAASNAAIQTTSVLAGGLVYEALGGAIPLTQFAPESIFGVIALCLAYLIVNYLMAGITIGARGLLHLRHYLHALPRLVFFEAAPLVFVPLVVLVYTRLGFGFFFLLSLVFIVASLISFSLARARTRLERRVKELDSLQAVGQALSASLDLTTILEAIHTQVKGLMSAENFYVALYDPQTDEVSFPLAVEEGEKKKWRSRRAGNGLTEYLIRRGKPLLINGNIQETVASLGVDHVGHPARSWLGVPIRAGEIHLGVIGVQSFSETNLYDASDLEVLETIAAQAAVAIQNARLYAQTDAALARRVQELDSIMATTREGILLLDRERRILAANRALAAFLGIAQMDLRNRSLQDTLPGDGTSLMSRIGFTETDWQAEEQTIESGKKDLVKQTFVVPGAQERHFERTMTPVRDRTGVITGWLLLFRDLTEEIELERMKDDMVHMLVHDLRAPLTTMMGSLAMLEEVLDTIHTQEVDNLVDLAKRGGGRLLSLVNELLDISKLENGQMPIHPTLVHLHSLLEDTIHQLSPLARDAHITVDLSVEQDLPLLTADPEVIGRVLYNLLDNAIKFTPDGGQIRLWSCADPGSDEPRLLVGVSDSGPGIPVEAQSRLFRKFQRIPTTKGRRRGSGLGLHYCKLAVEAHGGEIWVESQEGAGSKFIFRLPVREI